MAWLHLRELLECRLSPTRLFLFRMPESLTEWLHRALADCFLRRPAFEAVVSLNSSQTGQTFRWGVILDGPAGPNIWGIPTEVGDPNSTDQYRSFVLEGGGGRTTDPNY
jgi:hypothetical protein